MGKPDKEIEAGKGIKAEDVWRELGNCRRSFPGGEALRM
ncbi:hypothetical protein Daudx_1491 [Candidatus Desulforudis audaxviator]|nr:hypothetical protein Daudx_1491 [Candidatus Desulforudis audaxviator]